MPHFEALPPEINSHNMWGGRGPSSLVYAGQRWESLGDEMQDLKESFDEMLSCLTEQWSGEVAIQVINAAKPFQQWLVDLVEQIFDIERETECIMRAFCIAQDELVDPELIDANRAQMLALINDNELGLNNAAIEELEDEYADFWDQDGRAMKKYRNNVSAASNRLTPWQQPPPIATNTGLAQPVPLPTGS